MKSSTIAEPIRAGEKPEPAGFGATLLVWMALWILLEGGHWLGGFPSGMLAQGVEQGVARAESQSRGEVGDEVIRKAIRTQRKTLSFWSALAAIDDFLIEPAMLAGRAVLVATLFTGAAALSGRIPQYDRALLESARAQGFWVLGLATRLSLMVALRRGEADIETSAALLLPAGTHAAWLWLGLRQLDLFALVGWLVLARLAAKRRDTSPRVAVLICLTLAVLEAGLRVAAGLAMGGAIRLSLMVK